MPYVIPDLSGPDFQFPSGLLQQSPTALTPADVTTGVPTGPGIFDVLMRGFKGHLQEEYEAGRITGNEYTQAYIALTESAMNQGIAFLLGKDTAYWQAIATQVQAYNTRVEMESSKYTLENMLPQQLENLILQGGLIKEQTEAQRSQTLDVRTDGQVITGTAGKQKDLYSQQITSYQRNAEVAAAKIFSDAWITQKTIDDGLAAPEVFQNSSVNTVMSRVRSNNGLNT